MPTAYFAKAKGLDAYCRLELILKLHHLWLLQSRMSSFSLHWKLLVCFHGTDDLKYSSVAVCRHDNSYMWNIVQKQDSSALCLCSYPKMCMYYFIINWETITFLSVRKHFSFKLVSEEIPKIWQVVSKQIFRRMRITFYKAATLHALVSFHIKGDFLSSGRGHY